MTSQLPVVSNVNVTLWKDIEVTDILRQYDDYNCGVYVLLYAECLGRGGTIEKLEIDSYKMSGARRKIVMDLCLK